MIWIGLFVALRLLMLSIAALGLCRSTSLGLSLPVFFVYIAAETVVALVDIKRRRG